jgi:membrane protein DedA with SNARE-associated domain
MTNKQRKQPANAYLKYSGMAIQMGVIILIGVWAGKQLDSRMNFQKPWLTLAFSLLAVAAALYISLKDIISNK